MAEQSKFESDLLEAAKVALNFLRGAAMTDSLAYEVLEKAVARAERTELVVEEE